MSEKKAQYAVVRRYCNSYDTNELIRRIVRRHMKRVRPENTVKKCLDQEVSVYAGKEKP